MAVAELPLHLPVGCGGGADPPPPPTAGYVSPPPPGPDVDSFYHLAGRDVRTLACGGLACFVARRLAPHTFAQAEAESPRAYCLGKCYAGPATGSADGPRPHVAVDAPEAIVLRRIAEGGARTLDAYRRAGGYAALDRALRGPTEDVTRAVEASGLRGRGGAAFPTGRKWRAVLAQPGGPRYVVVNADEGDAGAYIDRFLLENDPHAVIEGATLAGYAVGASQGWIYLRCEYPDAAPILRQALAECRDAGILGPRVLGSDFAFDITLHVGRGSYVCGEETALLHSIEGRRPCPTVRPPFVAERGLFGRPTVVNNVETLANVPWIVQYGADAYRLLGIADSRGTKVVSLNSLFARPGLYEVELGIPVRRIVEQLGGGLRTGPLHGIMIGGPLAGVLPPDLLHTPLGFEEMREASAAVGHGGVVAFDHHTSIPELAHHVFAFAADESCGTCAPCRLGCRRLKEMFARVLRDPRARADRAEFDDLVALLRRASLCGHGAGVAEFAESILRHFEPELAPCFA